MTVSHAHARNACAHEQSTNIESGAVQWHKQLAELSNLCDKLVAKPPFCHKQNDNKENSKHALSFRA